MSGNGPVTEAHVPTVVSASGRESVITLCSVAPRALQISSRQGRAAPHHAHDGVLMYSLGSLGSADVPGTRMPKAPGACALGFLSVPTRYLPGPCVRAC